MVRTMTATVELDILSTHGGALSARYLSAVFSRLAYRAGVKRHAWDGVGTHSGRHTAATDVVGSGVPIQVAAEFLGHAKLDTTMLYTGRVRTERVRSAIEGRQYRQPAA